MAIADAISGEQKATAAQGNVAIRSDTLQGMTASGASLATAYHPEEVPAPQGSIILLGPVGGIRG